MARNRMRMPLCRSVVLAAMLISAVGIGRAEETESKSDETKSEKSDPITDSEHIFAFTEGTDIGEKGERELEFTFVGSLGKVGSYAELFNESAFRYVVTDQLRLSVGALSDFYSIHDVPTLANRVSFGVSGFDAEARYVILDRHQAPIGMDVGINPQWRHLDDVSGANTQSYAIPMTLVIEKDFVAEQIYTALNATYTPASSRLQGIWQHEDAFETSVAAAGIVAPNILMGAELRHLAVAENGTFQGEALFAGFSLFARLSQSLEAKIAWSAQLSGLSGRGLDVQNFDRHQVLLLIAYTF